MLQTDEKPAYAILVHFGELGLKGRNQPMFRRQLRRNLRLKLRVLGLDWSVDDAVGVLTVHVPMGTAEAHRDQVLAAIQRVFGVAWLSCARCLRPMRSIGTSPEVELGYVEEHLIALARKEFTPDQTFCVRVNRGNKFLPFTSPELASRLGQAIRVHTSWKKVDLKHADMVFHVDVRCKGTFLFGKKLRGPGGLPVGTSGRVLALLSGGIDSPVAAYLAAKRGCRVDFIHFAANSSDAAELQDSKIFRLAAQLSQYTLGARLFVVPYVHFDLALLRQKVDYELVLFRRFMVRVAEKLARQLRARALVTGDTLSQVASQTLTNLASTKNAVEMPILQPLVFFDKEETIALAQKIGTYEISIQPYKDCCAIISNHPKTRSHHDRLSQLEARVFPDYPQLLERTLVDMVCLEVPHVAGETSPNPALIANKLLGEPL